MASPEFHTSSPLSCAFKSVLGSGDRVSLICFSIRGSLTLFSLSSLFNLELSRSSPFRGEAGEAEGKVGFCSEACHDRTNLVELPDNLWSYFLACIRHSWIETIVMIVNEQLRHLVRPALPAGAPRHPLRDPYPPPPPYILSSIPFFLCYRSLLFLFCTPCFTFRLMTRIKGITD